MNVMKRVIIIPDGCADEPQDALEGKSPLEAAHIPGMDRIANDGVVGRANHVPAHLPAGSAVANMSLLGYDPCNYFTGRAPLEAAAQNIDLGPDDWAIRCNLVTVQDQMMRDFTADHITSEEAGLLLQTAQQKIDDQRAEFVPGVSYRNLLLVRSDGNASLFSNETRTVPPHDLTDKSVVDDFPRGPGSDWLNEMMGQSVEWFADHPVNQRREQNEQLPATNLWLWGLGKTPQLPAFEGMYGCRGSMITAVDLLRGIASLIGWECVEVPGATGYTDTDYAAKGRYAIETLSKADLVCVHIEAPDEASHEGDLQAKIAALEAIDQYIVCPLITALEAQGDYQILVSPDHPTPLRTKTHSHGFVPFTIAGTGIRPDQHKFYHERVASESSLSFEEGWRLMAYFTQTSTV